VRGTNLQVRGQVPPDQSLIPIITTAPSRPRPTLVATVRPLPDSPSSRSRRSLEDVPVWAWLALRAAPFVLVMAALAALVVPHV
jgi:hypothetical protein